MVTTTKLHISRSIVYLLSNKHAERNTCFDFHKIVIIEQIAHGTSGNKTVYRPVGQS